ncbi:uracil-DNA glycosylase [Halocynthiibacter sp. SDUM655004]|uniref:Type-4 uracil-DNA glycosylase n=1 Tax=Halocynthiibacter halioticoli TaxID=2986804 RepID=A0AAE3IZ85_9RHOB|nr:uracil-DNA glycosylase [Halocynthiibacter halioticoli]MCW4056202.1 uracil-DNA glycosylase [Halocynthiibacter sp. SDUM655004]
MESQLGIHEAKALLDWYIELGADEAILDAPVNCYDLPNELPKAASARKPERSGKPKVAVPVISQQEEAKNAFDAACKRAKEIAESCDTVEALKSSIESFDGCDLKKGARNTIFADGNPQASVMVIGEVPTLEEDRGGAPFIGAAGQMLDKMFAAIGLLRSSPDPETALYVSTVLPWRTPQDRPPNMQEIDMLRCFARRHIELADPKVVILMGNVPCQILLGKGNINRQRGRWTELNGRPTLPMLHPGRLLRTPAVKREAWADLLALQAKLRDLT